MRQLTFLLGSYYPNFSAVGYCAYQVQKCLAKDMDITVIAFRNEATQPLEELHEGARILRIETPFMKRSNVLKTKPHDLWAKVQIFAMRAVGALRRLLSRETVDRSLVTAYVARLNEMNPPPKAIIPLVFPIETVLAALEYKRSNPDTLVIPYLFDDYVDSGSLHVLKIAREIKRARHTHLERQILSESNAVLSMHPLRLHLESNFDSTILQKVTFLEHPLLSVPNVKSSKVDNGVIKLCYTGSLIRSVREPCYLLNLLRSIHSSVPVRADFYVMGNAARLVKSELLDNGLHIVNHGRVSKAEADSAVGQADILLNIGDFQGRQVSSKLFEYIASGKPVIHLSYVENDSISRILDRYPLGLCLVQSPLNFESNVKAFNDFVGIFRSKRISFADVKLIYPDADPCNTANIINKIIDGI